MSTPALVAPDEYVGMSFEGPDQELVEGELRERTTPSYRHSRVQARLIRMFYEKGQHVPLYPAPELRLRVGSERYRVADLAVFAGEEPGEPVPSTPPLVVVEIASPEDRYTEVLQKLEEYRNWGVPHVWVVDPSAGKLYESGAGGWNEVRQFSIPAVGLTISCEEVV